MWPQPWSSPGPGAPGWQSTSAASSSGVYPTASHLHAPSMGQPYAHSHHPSSMEGRQSQVTHERTSQSTTRSLGRSRTASTDLAFHPYKPAGRPAASSASSTPVPSTLMPQNITFVDTTQQASGFVDPLQQCRPKRKRISPEQLLRLTAVFDQTDSPSYDMRDQLGAEVGMTNREVQVWMQNRRAKMNRQRQAALAKEAAEMQALVARHVPPEAQPVKVQSETMSAGQHQWRFRAGAQTAQPIQQTVVLQQPSTHSMAPPSTRRPPPPQLSLPPAHSQPMIYRHPQHSPHHSQSLPNPPQTYPQSPLLISPPSYPPTPGPMSPSVARSPMAGHSYFPHSPAVSVAASSLASPGSVTSSFFSRGDAPFTPATTISSPSNGFFRLTLESPCMPPLSPTSYGAGSPDPNFHDAPIHLAPIRSGHFRPRTGSSRDQGQSRPRHRRSISDSAAHAAFLPPAVASSAAVTPSAGGPPPVTAGRPRLPSLRGLLNSDESAPTSPKMVSPTSTLDGFAGPPPLASPSVFQAPYTSPLVSRPFPRPSVRSASPSSLLSPHALSQSFSGASSSSFPPARPRLASRYSSMNIHRLPSVERDPEEMYRRSPLIPSPSPMAVDGDEDAPLGLGMLCAAATELSSGDEKEQRLHISQRMR